MKRTGPREGSKKTTSTNAFPRSSNTWLSPYGAGYRFAAGANELKNIFTGQREFCANYSIAGPPLPLTTQARTWRASPESDKTMVGLAVTA
jgi:hypothetical protein